MSNVKDITDSTPNQGTIKHLEGLLEKAKSGELRTVFDICGWDDDTSSTGWSFDSRNSMIKFLGRLSIAKAEIECAMLLKNPDTDLRQALDGYL